MADKADRKYSDVVKMKNMPAEALNAQEMGSELVRRLVEQQLAEVAPDARHSKTHSKSHSRTGARAQ